MAATVLGEFDGLAAAQGARTALLAAGVPEVRITLSEDAGRTWTLSVYAESSFEREHIQGLLQRQGARHTVQLES